MNMSHTPIRWHQYSQNQSKLQKLEWRLASPVSFQDQMKNALLADMVGPARPVKCKGVLVLHFAALRFALAFQKDNLF